MEKVNLNFKVDKETKTLLDQLVVFKTSIENRKSSQHAVLIEALTDLFGKYKQTFSNIGATNDSIQS